MLAAAAAAAAIVKGASSSFIRKDRLTCPAPAPMVDVSLAATTMSPVVVTLVADELLPAIWAVTALSIVLIVTA
ncbi:MAG: hypothetical protein ACKOGA_17815, partial [Planctomycetaceae bacterium]